VVHLVHEVLVDFLNHSLYVDYALEYFNLNPNGLSARYLA